MKKQNIDLDRAKLTLTRLITLLCFIGYIVSYINPIIMELTLIMVFLGLVLLLLMEHYKGVAQRYING